MTKSKLGRRSSRDAPSAGSTTARGTCTGLKCSLPYSLGCERNAPILTLHQGTPERLWRLFREGFFVVACQHPRGLRQAPQTCAAQSTARTWGLPRVQKHRQWAYLVCVHTIGKISSMDSNALSTSPSCIGWGELITLQTDRLMTAGRFVAGNARYQIGRKPTRQRARRLGR